jgi:hypothetical protein
MYTIQYTKKYILKQLVNYCTGEEDFMAVAKETVTCGLSRVLTLSIISSLLQKRCVPNQFFMKVDRWQ